MTQRGKHFTFGSPGTASTSSQSSSAWGKGLLCGLGLVLGAVLLTGVVAPQHCALDGPGAVNYLSLNVGGFSVFIHWNAFGCR